MADFCIISEFNPMHNGHKYIVEKARELGADSVSVVMSGNATQRGELAVADKYLRGKAAVMSGVDLALELPYFFVGKTSESFASLFFCFKMFFNPFLMPENERIY